MSTILYLSAGRPLIFLLHREEGLFDTGRNLIKGDTDDLLYHTELSSFCTMKRIFMSFIVVYVFYAFVFLCVSAFIRYEPDWLDIAVCTV